MKANPWLSVHIYLGAELHAPEYDLFLVNDVSPLVRRMIAGELIDGFFFVRYVDDGPHLRLRVRSVFDADTAQSAHPAQLVLEELGRVSPEVRLKWIAYEAEVDRYGGPRLIGVLEKHFCESSLAITDLMHQLDLPDRESRLGSALLLMLAYVKGFAIDARHASTLFQGYSNGYLARIKDPAHRERMRSQIERQFNSQCEVLVPAVCSSWKQILEHDLSDSRLKQLFNLVHQLCVDVKSAHTAGEIVIWNRSDHTWMDCARQILLSAMHMTSNRLGITTLEEAYLAHVAAQALNSDVLGRE